MRFTHRVASALPRLGYVGTVGGGEVELVHGSHVEVVGERFTDGAWSGDFGSPPAPDDVLAGTVGFVDGGELVLVAPQMPVDRVLLVVEPDGRVVFANSLPVLLAALGDELDPGDVATRSRLVAVELGVRLGPHTIPTAGGRTVRVVLDEEVRIGADGAVRSELRPLDRPFRSYADYRSFLAASFAAVVANASDGRRAHPLTPLPSISAGYDSAAIAVLASEVGIDRALTMLRPEGDPPVLVDHPGVLAEVLGIELVGVERGGWRDDPSMPEALVAASGVTFMDVVMLTYRDHLPGALLVVGHSGDNVWSAGNFRAYQDVVQGAGRISGRGLAEHRLEVGYVLFAPATAGHTAHPSIFRLSGAAEMSPWDVGGSYNRPIARRIVEEAGVPRGSFATRKFAGSGRVGSSRTSYRGHDRAERAAELAEVMTPAGVASFLDHVDALAAEGRGLADARVRRRIAVGRVGHRLFEKLDALNHHVGRRLHRIGIKALVPRRVMIRAARHVIVHPDHTYLLAHWGTSVCAARHLADGPLLGGSTDPVNPAPEALLPS